MVVPYFLKQLMLTATAWLMALLVQEELTGKLITADGWRSSKVQCIIVYQQMTSWTCQLRCVLTRMSATTNRSNMVMTSKFTTTALISNVPMGNPWAYSRDNVFKVVQPQLVSLLQLQPQLDLVILLQLLPLTAHHFIVELV